MLRTLFRSASARPARGTGGGGLSPPSGPTACGSAGFAAGFGGTEFLTAPANTDLDAGTILDSTINAGMTFSLWVRPTTVDGTFRKIFQRGEGNTAAIEQFGLQITNANNYLFYGVNSDDTYKTVDPLHAAVAGTWVYIRCELFQVLTNQWTPVISFNNGGDSTGAVGSNVAIRSNRLTIGNAFGLPAVYNGFSGRIDSFGIWNRLLTTPEKDYLYNGGLGQNYLCLPGSLLSGLVSWWDLDEATGTSSWVDQQGNNTATATGTVNQSPPRNS